MAGCRSALILFMLVVASSGSALGEEIKKDEWHPEPPPGMPEKWDWIRLVSGEWLKGKLMVMYDEKVEFDSDEMDEQTIDLEDIKEIRTGQIVQIRFLHNIDATGKLHIDGDKVRVIGEEDRTFDRSQVLTITAGEPKEINYWSFKLTLGANFRRGNSEQTEINNSTKIMRRTVENRITVEFRGAYNITDGVQTVNNQRGSAVWDKFLTAKLFVNPIFVEYYRDPFQNVGDRVTLGVGAGYQIIDTTKTEWEVSGGPAYQRTLFDDVVPGTPEEESTPALVVSMVFDKELTRAIDLIQEYRLQITNKVSGSFNHHWVTTLETEITKLLDFDISFVWDRIRNPRRNSDGTLPNQNDVRLIVGLTFDF